MSHQKTRFSAIFCFMFALSCADSVLHSNTDLDGDGGDLSVTNKYFMVPVTPGNIRTNVATSTPLEVFLYSKKTGDVAPSQTIKYEIVESVEGASLASLEGVTGSDGKASVELRASSNPSTMTIRASHPSANSHDFVVDMLAMTVGTLEVTPVNAAPTIMELKDIELRLYRQSEFSCDEFRPFFEQPTPLTTVTASVAGEQANFENLATLDRFILTAVARGDRDQVAAAACEDKINISPETVTREELLLNLVELNPVGQYNVTSNWDFLDAIADSGPVGFVIVDILNMFDNPGAALYKKIIDLIGLFLNGAIAAGIEAFLDLTGLDKRFADMINDFIEGNSTLREIRDVGRDLRDIIANLEVSSRLTIGKVSSDLSFRGTDNWSGVTLYWRRGCDENSPADCGAIYLGADIDGEIADLGIVSSNWNGNILSYNQLKINSHPVSLRYGRLIIYILNNVMIPALTNNKAFSLSEAFEYWIGCESLANTITGSDRERCAFGSCITADDISGFCGTATGAIFGIADVAIKGLEFDIGLRLEGEGMLFETDSDGRVDVIESGIYDGTIVSTDVEPSDASMPTELVSPFSATWSAVRISENGAGTP